MICNVYSLHKYFNPAKLDTIYSRCVAADIGCVEDKEILSTGINEMLREFREKREELASNPKYVSEVLAEGAERARSIAQQTLSEVRERMGISQSI